MNDERLAVIATNARAVSFQIIWRLLSRAIWRMMDRTKGADSHDRPGFVVRKSARKIALDRFRLIQPHLEQNQPLQPLHVPRAFLTCQRSVKTGQ